MTQALQTENTRTVEADLIAFFDAHGGLPGESIDEQLDFPFLSTGVISSLGLVELVMHVEGTYGVRLGPDDLQGPAFQTVRGIAQLLREKRS